MNTDILGHIVNLLIAVLGIYLTIKSVVLTTNAEIKLPLVIIGLVMVIQCVRMFCTVITEIKTHK